MSDSLKKLSDSLISSHCSFDLSEMSNSLTSLTKKEKMSKNERFAHFFKKIFKKTLIKTWWNKILDFFSQICLSKSLIRSFPLSKMSNSLTSLISSERPEQIAHGCSFLVSDLSDSLRVAHLSWVICANLSQSHIWFEWNEQMSDEQMSEFPALVFTQLISSPLKKAIWHYLICVQFFLQKMINHSPPPPLLVIMFAYLIQPGAEFRIQRPHRK